MKRIIVTAVAMALLAGCSPPGATPTPTPTLPPEPEVFTVSGTLTLHQVTLRIKPGDECNGRDGFADVRQGAQVAVTDAAGKVVGLGALGAGAGSAVGNNTVTRCVFTLAVTNIPDGGEIYGIQVAHRGVVNFRRMDAVGMTLDLG